MNQPVPPPPPPIEHPFTYGGNGMSTLEKLFIGSLFGFVMTVILLFIAAGIYYYLQGFC